MKVEVLKQLPRLLEDRQLHSVPVGAVVEVPRWMAEVLERGGYVRVVEDEAVDLASLSKLSWREERSPGPLPAPETLYPKVRSYLERLRREASSSLEAHTAMRQAEVKVRDLVRCRLQKVVQAALSPSVPRGLIDNLAPEERFLYERVRQLIEDWVSSIEA